MSFSSPKAPDPVATASAQSTLDHVSQYTPWGSSVYTQTGKDSQGVPMYSQTTSLSAPQQQLFNQQQSQDLQLGQANQNYANQIQANSGNAGSINGGSSMQYGADANPIQYSLGGGNTNRQVMNAENASYNQATSYLNPQMANQQSQLNAQLANQGITQGSEAWQNAQDEQARNSAFAYNQAQDSAVQAGQNEQNTLFGQNLSAGQFANAAQDQGFSQNSQNAQLNNQANQQAFEQNAYNENEPINQYSALNGLTQVSAPQFAQTTPAPNIAGMYQNNYNQGVGSYNNTIGGLFSLGAGAARGATTPSDMRLKTDIVPVGATKGGIPVYEYSYIGSDDRHIGVMAQEVELIIPEAVVIEATGFKAVYYSMVH